MEACGCIYVPDYEPADFYDATIRKARKVHKCCECDQEIHPGEKYEHAACKCEGYIDTFKTCLDCVSVRDVFFCEGFLHGCLWEYLSGHIQDMQGSIKSDCLVPLTPKAREKVCELIEEAWIDWEE